MEKHYYVMDYKSGGTMCHKVLQEKCLSKELAGFYAAELNFNVQHVSQKNASCIGK
jgi:hypothetical protein